MLKKRARYEKQHVQPMPGSLWSGRNVTTYRYNVYELLSILLSLRVPLMIINSANQKGYTGYFKRDAHRREHYRKSIKFYYGLVVAAQFFKIINNVIKEDKNKIQDLSVTI